MRYTVILEQEPDGGYVASVPALPAVSAKVTTVPRPCATSVKPWNFTSRIAATPVIRCPSSPARNSLKSRPRKRRDPLRGQTPH